MWWAGPGPALLLSNETPAPSGADFPSATVAHVQQREGKGAGHPSANYRECLGLVAKAASLEPVARYFKFSFRLHLALPLGGPVPRVPRYSNHQSRQQPYHHTSATIAYTDCIHCPPSLFPAGARLAAIGTPHPPSLPGLAAPLSYIYPPSGRSRSKSVQKNVHPTLGTNFAPPPPKTPPFVFNCGSIYNNLSS